MSDDKPIARWDMDHMHDHTCHACGYRWVMPAAKGNCPKCKSSRTVAEGHRINVLKRV